jgi:hypothetical protein
MSTATDRLDALIDDYLLGKRRFMGFWSAFMECWERAQLADAEVEAYSEAYDVVYMGGPGPIAPRDSVLGLLSESDVRARLRACRDRAKGGRS